MNGRRLAVAAATLAVLLGGLVAPAPRAAAGEGFEILCQQRGYGCVEGKGYEGQGIWGANHFRTGHNCTSYVSYMLARAGASQPWRPMGNANRWDDNGRGKVPIDDVPAIGAVAQWEGGTRLAPNAMGHVGLVDVVGPDYIEVSDDGSGDTTRRMRISRGSPYWPSSFIHIWDRTAVPELAARAFAVGAAPFRRAGPGAEVAGWWTTNRSVARQPWSWFVGPGDHPAR